MKFVFCASPTVFCYFQKEDKQKGGETDRGARKTLSIKTIDTVAVAYPSDTVYIYEMHQHSSK